MRCILLLMTILVASGTASVMGPMETLQENSDSKSKEESADPPGVMELGRMVITAMQSLLANQERSMEARLKQLELYVDHTCRNSRTIQTPQNPPKVEDFKSEMSQMMDGYMNYMSSMAHVFADNLQQQIDSKIELAMVKIEEKLNDITALPKLHHASDDAHSLNTTSSSYTSSSGINDYKTLSVLAEKIEDQLKNVVTRSDLHKQTKQTDKQIRSIISLLNNGSSYQVLNYTKNIRDILYSFKPVYETFRKVVKNCDVKEDQFNQMERFEQLLQELKVEVDDNGNILSNMFLALEGAGGILTDKLTALESLTEQINSDGPHLPTTSPPTASSPFPKGSRRDCKDSAFLGGKHRVDVCSTAVRYEKCHIEVVAYHCCRTCTDAGQLPDEGPHRYLTYPRKINLFGRSLE